MNTSLRIDATKTNEQILCDEWVRKGWITYILNTLAMSCRIESGKYELVSQITPWIHLAQEIEKVADEHSNF